jgi:hypothetical protein
MASLGAPQLLGAGARCPSSTIRKQLTCRLVPRTMLAVNTRVSSGSSYVLHKADLPVSSGMHSSCSVRLLWLMLAKFQDQTII